MPNQTKHYQLNQWDPEDNFLRMDFNQDNAKLDAALALKSEVVSGTYVGDGAASRTISLGFTPKAVLVCSRDGKMNAGYYNYGGLALEGLPCTNDARGDSGSPVVAIVEGGFTVHYRQISTSYFIYSNEEKNHFYYLALRQ